MKKTLLLAASLILGAVSYAQFTENNAPTIGQGQSMYSLVETTPNLSNQTGSSASWDYSNAVGIIGDIRNVSVLEVGATPHGEDYPSSEAAFDIEDFLTLYFTSNADARVGQGFVFVAPGLGEVAARFGDDNATIMTYPFDFGSETIVDEFAGDATIDLPEPAGQQEAPLTGTVYASVDGVGTLKLAENTYSDVIRYKLQDTAQAFIQLDLGFTVVDVIATVSRTQYEYYAFSESNLPLFIHSHVDVDAGEANSFLPDGPPVIDVILTIEEPTESVEPAAVEDNILSNVSIYPNPATDGLNISLPEGVDAANISILDAMGRVVYTSVINAGFEAINISNLEKGMYFVNIESKDYSTTKNVVIR